MNRFNSYGYNDSDYSMNSHMFRAVANKEEATSIYSWISSYRDLDEMREIFLNMDRAMKYIHEHGYCIGNFDPREIEILNNSVDQIRFNNIIKMPNDYANNRKIIKDDIYNSSFIQIGLYANCLSYLKRDFLKKNFDEFSIFIPEGDIPYYRGVIERGASVYFSEYALEKANRDLAALEAELAGEDGKGISKPTRKIEDNGVNDRINASIYKQISGGMKDSAFVRLLIFPTVILVLCVFFALMLLFFNLS